MDWALVWHCSAGRDEGLASHLTTEDPLQRLFGTSSPEHVDLELFEVKDVGYQLLWLLVHVLAGGVSHSGSPDPVSFAGRWPVT